MATPAQVPIGAPQQQGGAPSPEQAQGGGSSQALKMLGGITTIAQMIAKQYAAASPDMEQILNSVQSAMRKIIVQQPGQPQQAPPF